MDDKAVEIYGENGLTGPLREQYHPQDAEGAGRSRYWDTPTADRAKQLPKILKLTAPFSSCYDQEFARGWLSEADRARAAKASAGSRRQDHG